MSTSTRPDPRPQGLSRRDAGRRHPWSWAAWMGIALWGSRCASPSADRADAKPSASAVSVGLKLISAHALTITEPSDLALDGSGESLWTVTDRPGRVHELGLDGTFRRTL